MTLNSQPSTLNSSVSDWDRSAEAWIRFVDEGDPNRDILLDPVMVGAAGNVNGKRICDIGCGEGRFCRILAKRGARVTGTDPTRTLIRAAQQRDPSGEYILSGAESLPFDGESFDLGVSYLNLIDIEDYRLAIREMTRILKPGGALIVANLNGHATASMTGWTKSDSGEKLYFAIDRYLEPRGVRVSWCGIEVVNYHRPLSDYMKAFLGTGLTLDFFEEPAYPEAYVRTHPDFKYDNRVPFFVVMRWTKPHDSPGRAALGSHA